MVHVILFCCAMIGDDAKLATATPADHAAYESAVTKAGKDAAAQVRLALWCEQHGLSAERVKHLALAITCDPANVLARGLSGLVAYRGKWKSPKDVGQDVKNDPAYKELIRGYLERRAKAPHKADAQLKLAAWCTEKGLKEQALAHYSEVTRLDPSRETPWKHLGYKRQGNRWVKPEDAAAQKAEADRQRRADQRWKPRLEKLREGLESSQATRRDKAREGLSEVTDPRAVPMIWKVFGPGPEAMQLVAVQLFSQIEGPAASFCLAALAVDNPSAEVRRRATQVLKGRDPRDVIGRLIAVVHKPFKYEVKTGKGPGSTASLMVDGERFDIRRFYRYPDIDIRMVPGLQVWEGGQNFFPGRVAFAVSPGRQQVNPSPFALMFAELNMSTSIAASVAQSRQMMAAAAVEQVQRENAAVQQTLDDDVRMLDEANARINATNDRALPLLQTLTGQDLGDDPKPWQKWWSDQLGFVADDTSSSSTKPVLTDTVTMPDLSVPVAIPQWHNACFAAGTLVQALDGPRPIESIQIGDRVLSQNTSTGSLAFEPVTATHRNQPAPTLKLVAGGETIVATGIHRFWKAGKGWTMARDLKAGDRLRRVGGVVAIESIEPDETQRVYNLDVADNRNFFVGRAGLLVHDFTFVQPVLAPFDRLPESDVSLNARLK
jgi:tetratricopeptide (TPR) repeat protein